MKGCDTLNRKKQTVIEMSECSSSAVRNDIKRSSVHHILLERAYDIVIYNYPQYERILSPMLKYMLHVVKKPDRKGDYENGLGRHYYCAVGYGGVKAVPVCGYYKNGTGSFGKSARTMFEEDHTMALTMYKAGFIKEASSYLGRAVHMLSDMCCLPHALCMTYFSPYAKLHRAYEKLASYIYPDMVPPKKVQRSSLSFFADRESFSHSLNSIAECIKHELPLLHSDPQHEVIIRLYDTESKLAAYLVRFCEDLSMSAARSHYITEGMVCRGADKSSCTVHIAEKGIMLIKHGRPEEIYYDPQKSCTFFSAAHRKRDKFTLSPVRCSADRVLKNKTFSSFDPREREQYFRLMEKKK